MQRLKRKYISPAIQAKKIKINFFSRFFELNQEINPVLLAGCPGGPLDPDCDWSCFIAGTKILMGDGNLKNIENVLVNDLVVSYSLENGEKSESRVVKLIRNQKNSEGLITLNHKIKVTPMHLFWTNGKEWKRAKELKAGDWLSNSKANKVQLENIDKTSGENSVYNLELDGEDHNYFAEGVLVHNWK